MSAIERARISVTQTGVDHANIRHCPLSSHALTMSQPLILPSDDGDETNHRLPVCSLADEHPALIPDAIRDVPNSFGEVDDSVRSPSSPWPSEDPDSPLDREPVVSDVDRLDVHLLGLTLPNGRDLISNVSFSAHPGSLTAIIGPSGAGKSTLAKLVAGALAPTTGEVRFNGHDLHAEYGLLRHRIGLVPQDDVVHHQLTLEAALRYAAELRLPDATKDVRRQAVCRVLAELELTGHAHTRVDKLSGGQRKRASVALELLTGPSLLILDEPTTGLDPALDRQVMKMLRRLADAGRVVLVVTHCLTYLDVCDQVLFLTPGGKTAYCGPPRDIGTVLGSTDWADLFTQVGADPDTAHRRFLTRSHAQPALPSPPRPVSTACVVPCRLVQQISTVARRQVRLVWADRGYLIFLAVLPFILGTLALLVPGHTGLGAANPREPNADEAAQIVMLLNISAVFMGSALSIRDLVGERAIFRREQAAGLSATAYLVAKTVVYSATTALQTSVLTAIVVAGKGAPTRGAVVVGNPILELYLTLAATAAVATLTGLALSAAARSHDQILPMLVISVMLSMVFCGGLIPVTGRPILDELSWAVPARWGFAATASTTDLRAISPLTPQNETLWSHHAGWWLLNMTLLGAMGALLVACARWRLRLCALSPISYRTARKRALVSVGLGLTSLVGYRVTRLVPSD